MKHVFIINPVSGKSDARALMPEIEAACGKAGVEPVFEITGAPKHAVEITRGHSAAGEAVRLYAVGGDGTLNEVFEGAWRYPNAEVASIPCGSGNDFVRSFGQPEDFLDFDAQLAGAAYPIDLIEVDGGVCAAITSTGLDAEVAYNIPKYRRIPLLGGTMAYNISIVEKLLKPLGKRLRVTIDGEAFEDTLLIATVCNAQHYGGGYQAGPMALLDDGVLDVILVKKISRLLIASVIGKYKRGNHWVNGAIDPGLSHLFTHRRAKEVLIEPTGTEPFILNVDGECGPAKRLFAKVMPKAARFVLPAAMVPNAPLLGK
ncbi:protein BmrU [Ruminococcaceae bacterium OttesenSCG-928-D13]|nr:protein BmrU [Ruminococcaceae bacterium OttesenSCG-928-D13]